MTDVNTKMAKLTMTLRAMGFSPTVSSWAVGWMVGKVCLDCISETIRCRKLILGRDIA